VKDVTLGAYAHQDMPFDKLVEEIRPERMVRQVPLVNVAFGVQNAPMEEVRLDGVSIKPLVIEQEVSRFDLAIWVTESVEEMRISWIYSKDLFEEDTVTRMHRHFETLLFSIVDRPDVRLSALNMAPRAEARSNHPQ
jgi:non-ribosomal peptide synthetase component F